MQDKYLANLYLWTEEILMNLLAYFLFKKKFF
ncbi:hypothetical protein X279_08535 [Oenococcus oeni IOEB_0501]|nr:hypothetical protein X278_02565 [Oenococcus oeni IOEB_0205]KEP87366.1 hypothetical protein X279_08535 [Oenococcus oeni IOEB_0501]